MTNVACGTLQERMPEVAAGTAEWTPSEMAHLAGCDECARDDGHAINSFSRLTAWW